MKLQIWSRELATPTLWPSGALSGVVSTRDQKLRGHVTWPRPFGKFLRGHVRTVPGKTTVNLNSVGLTVGAISILHPKI